MSSPINTSENELAAIRQELNELRQTVAGLRNGNGHHNGSSLLEANAPTDRRGMLKTVAGLAVGVATVGLLRPSSSSGAFKAKPGSPDATGGPLNIGQTNAPTAAPDKTNLQNPSTDVFPLLFIADNWNANQFVVPASTFISLAGHVDNGGGTPTSGDFVGVWGESQATAGGTSTGMVAVGGASVTLADRGRFKESIDGASVPSFDVGLAAFAGIGGDGVYAQCDGSSSSWALHGISDLGLGGAFAGGRAALGLFVGSGAVANPNSAAPGGGSAGDVYRGSTNGSAWYNAGGTNPYRRLADSTTAGALSLQAPQRLVDTRTGSGFAGAGAHLGTDTLQTYNIRTLAGLPVGTRGMVGRITIVNATQSGGLQESPNPPPGPGNDLGFGTAVVNYPPASTIPAFGVPLISALDSSGNIRIHSIMAAGSADVIIDITGYYL